MGNVETTAQAIRRKYGTCRHCHGFVEFGRDEYQRRTGKCINCGRENVQRVMPAEEVEATCGAYGGEHHRRKGR
mgnify:CR=1 FL=1